MKARYYEFPGKEESPGEAWSPRRRAVCGIGWKYIVNKLRMWNIAMSAVTDLTFKFTLNLNKDIYRESLPIKMCISIDLQGQVKK